MSLQATPGSDQGAILLIDFQRDFVEPTGRMPAAQNQIPAALAAASRALARAKINGDLVVTIGNEYNRRDYLRNLLRRHAAIAGSDGARWSERLEVDGAHYFSKWASSAFVNPELDAWLRAHGVTTLTLCGLMARACITATAEEALAKGYDVQILEDAVACYSDASRKRALAHLKTQGARVISATT
ncbi:MAG: cysteine hydrolase [Bradyrhizobium sp.]|nr:MAG: cysteine hydrolase [Bradyrhizobium sp.]